jgi:SAM-dependent methyltransferase
MKKLEGIAPIIPDFSEVTEMDGQRVSLEQLERTCHRYHWALDFVRNKDVVEVACGSGPGLELLAASAKSLKAGDISETVLAAARKTYVGQIELSEFSAESLPFADSSIDVIILYEAIYYIDALKFIGEAKRVLRDDGIILIASANCGLFDFTPSPYSTKYYNSVDLYRLFHGSGFDCQLSGYLDVGEVSTRQKILRPVKLLASKLNLMPQTMRGKEFLKKLFFGKMSVMPASIMQIKFQYKLPTPIGSLDLDIKHKVIYCAARKHQNRG